MHNPETKNSKGGEKMEPRQEVEDRASELWFRREEMSSLQNKNIFTTVRLGNREKGHCEAKGCYPAGYFVTVKILKEPQRQEFEDWQTEIVITNIQVKPLGQITSEDLARNSQGQRTPAELAKKLSEFYSREIKPDEPVTLIHFEYWENLKTAEDLVQAKVLKLAQLPPDNPDNFAFDHYSVPLIEHDYPAKTAIMWNTAYHEFGMPISNIMLVGDPTQSGQILEVLRQDPKFQGGGAGVGFKDEAIKYLDELDPLAQAIGSINFILKTPEGNLKGFNTDGVGYALSLEKKLQEQGQELKGKKVVMLGAGGTGNAIAFALVQKGAQLIILNRTIAKAENLAQRINQHLSLEAQAQVRFGGEELVEQEVQNADVIINVSTKGAAGEMEKYNALAPAKLPATPENIQANAQLAEKLLQTISQQAIISDIVLTTETTPLMRSAQQAGFATLGGIPMVVNQGVEAFWLLYEKELKAKNISKEQVANVMKKATGL